MSALGDYGGQRANMEHESMVGTLRAQAAIVWPKEREVLRAKWPEPWGAVLDLGCGTGEILRRVRAEFDAGPVVGLDLFAGHLRHAEPPVARGDGYRTPFPDATFDRVLVRHLLQALPDPVALLKEARRVLKPGGRLHVLAEDYAGLFFDTLDFAVANHFAEVAPRFFPEGTDLYEGRRAPRHVAEAGFREVVVDPVLVDNRSADRAAFAQVFANWRDGYADKLAQLLGKSEPEIRARFDAMGETALSEDRWCAWLLFAVSATK